MNAEEFCREAAAPAGSSFHYATLFHDPEERRALFALFAMRAEIAKIDAGTQDPAVSAMRRSWWAEELARVAARQPRHPVGIEIRRLADRIDLDLVALACFAAGNMAPDSGAMPAAGIWGEAARACGVSDAAAIESVNRIGALVDTVETLAAGHATAEPGIGNRLGHIADGLDGAGDELIAAGAGRAEFCRIMAGLSAALCVELRRDTAAIGRSRVALTPLRKLWIAWRIHRRRAA